MYLPSLVTMADKDLTLKTVLDHMQNMQRSLTLEMQDVRKEVRAVERRLTHRMDRVESTLTMQIDAIEIETLPQRVATLEVAVGLR